MQTRDTEVMAGRRPTTTLYDDDRATLRTALFPLFAEFGMKRRPSRPETGPIFSSSPWGKKATMDLGLARRDVHAKAFQHEPINQYVDRVQRTDVHMIPCAD